jgi:tRNA pseudouridine38-40 synthase
VARFKLVVEYAGTRYRGWQVQKNARTVQGELRRAAEDVAGRRELELYGSGRTDAGVHALAQVAHLDLETTLRPDALRMALNDRLPPDINVLSVERVSRRFHARHLAQARTKPYVWWVKDPLDLERMRAAAALFVGFNDFRSFTAEDPEETSTRVQVDAVEVQQSGDLILVRIRGSHFVWKMVRRVVGVLVEVARGDLALDEVPRLLRQRSDLPGRLTAPPSGLFLERVFYEGERQDLPLRPAVAVAIRTPTGTH